MGRELIAKWGQLLMEGGDDCGQKEKEEKEVRELLTDKSGVLDAHRFLLPIFLDKKEKKNNDFLAHRPILLFMGFKFNFKTRLCRSL